MRKLLELINIKNEVIDLLYTQVQLPTGINICVHLNAYIDTSISIFKDSTLDTPRRTIKQGDIVFSIDDSIDEQTVDEIIAQIEKVLA